MNAAAHNPQGSGGTTLLLRHCNALDAKPQPSADARLEALLGNELARRLVAALAPR